MTSDYREGEDGGSGQDTLTVAIDLSDATPRRWEDFARNVNINIDEAEMFVWARHVATDTIGSATDHPIPLG